MKGVEKTMMRFVRENIEMTCVSSVSIVGLCVSVGLSGLTGLDTGHHMGTSSASGEQQWLLVDAERDEGEPRRPGDGINRYGVNG